MVTHDRSTEDRRQNKIIGTENEGLYRNKQIPTNERIIPVEPPIVNINKKRSPKNGELVLSSNNAGLPRYVLFQLKIFVPVGNDIKIVTPEK